MRLFILANRRGAGGRRGSTSGRERRLASSSAAALCLASGCTLTSDSFEPGLVERNVLEGAPPPAAAPGTAGSGVNPDAPAARGTGEELPDARLDPTGAGGAEEGAVSAERDTGGGDAASALPGRNPATDAGAPLAPSESCSTGTFGSSCYEFFEDPVTWQVAEDRCVAWGGHLASVGSLEEDGFLTDWLRGFEAAWQEDVGTWLGGTDAAGEAEFTWSDGSALTHEGWGPNQPDNGIGADCIEKRNDDTARWYDRRCDDQHQAVCERPL